MSNGKTRHHKMKANTACCLGRLDGSGFFFDVRIAGLKEALCRAASVHC